MQRIIGVLLACTFFGCAGTGPAVRQEAEAGKEQDLQAMIQFWTAREAKGLKPRQSQGDLKISVLAQARPQAKLIGSDPAQYQLVIPVGASVDATCYLTESLSSPAVTIKTIFDGIAETPHIQSVSVKTIEAVIPDSTGSIYLEAEYLTTAKEYGVAKIFASSTINSSFYCIHDELGYKQTFMEVADSLINSSYFQEFAELFSGYDKKQIDVVYLNNMAVGYTEGHQYTDEENVKRSIQFSSTLLAVSPNELTASDSVYIIDYEGESGVLLSGSYYSDENGRENYAIELEQLSPKRYQVEGVIQGRNFNEVIESGQPLIFSGFCLDRFIQGGNAEEQVFEEYHPLSPTRPVTSKMTLKETLPNGHKKLDYSFHTIKAVVEFDEKSSTRMDMDLGSISLLSERKFFDGI